jgi:phage gpG-like protein
LIKSDIEANFRDYGRTSGETSNITIFSGGEVQWKQLAPSTIKAYRKKGYETRPTLDKHAGGLRRSIGIQKLSNWQVMITGNMPYSAIHQYGKTIEHSQREGSAKWKAIGSKKTGYKFRFAKKSSKRAIERKFKVGAYKVVIPARPYITLTPEDVTEIVNLISLYIVPQGSR